MFTRAMFIGFLVLSVLVVSESARAASTTPEAQRVTLTGTGKALGDANAKADPTHASATLTVTDSAGKETVYDVCGWAGVIVAKQGDGKKVEVSGVVYEKDGRMRIVGKSIDVKIVVVDDKK